METIIFKTLSKSRAVIIKQNAQYLQKGTGKDKDKVVKKRLIRYVEDASSIYVDEQNIVDKDMQASVLIINNGKMTVRDDNPTLLEFLRAHPDNLANGGDIFKELDVENEAIFEIQNYEITDEAVSYAMKGSETEVMGAAIWLFNPSYIHKKIYDVRLALRQRIQADIVFAKLVNEYFAEKNNDEKQIITLALSNKVIGMSNGKDIVWYGTDNKIFSGSQANDVIKEMSLWVVNDEEGRTTIKAISQKLGQEIKEAKKAKES